MQLEDGTSIEYLIDGQGRRVGKKVDGVMDWRLVYRSLLQPVAEVDAAGTVITRFVYATGRNIPDYAVRGSDTYALLTDHLGSLRLVVNTSTGAVVQRMDYDPWGKVINDEHTGFDPLPFGFAGGIYDRDTELVHFGAREYDPAVGRWISKDPIRFAGGDTNIFAYVGGDPINWVDPEGCTASAASLLWLGVPVIGPTILVSTYIGAFVVGMGANFAGDTTLQDVEPPYRTANGNVADTGIVGEVNRMLQNGEARDRCQALEMLYRSAKQCGNRERMNKIKATQKALNCRRSRHSR